MTRKKKRKVNAADAPDVTMALKKPVIPVSSDVRMYYWLLTLL
jgi:hypothetical protein